MPFPQLCAVVGVIWGLNSWAESHPKNSLACQDQNIEQAFSQVRSQLMSDEDWTSLKWQVKEKDLKNGYFSYENEDMMGLHGALFKDNQQSRFLVTTGEGGSQQALNTFKCEGGIWHKYEDNTLKEFTPERSLPLYQQSGLLGKKLSDGKTLDIAALEEWGGLVKVHLPKKGRDIRLTSGIDDSAVYGKPIGLIRLQKGEFVIVKDSKPKK